MSAPEKGSRRPGRPRRSRRPEPQPVRGGLADQLRRSIEGSGRSLTELAELAGVPTSAVSRFLTGERDIRLGTAERIAKLLGLGLQPSDRRKTKATAEVPGPG